jgi:hypothetical protein
MVHLHKLSGCPCGGSSLEDVVGHKQQHGLWPNNQYVLSQWYAKSMVARAEQRLHVQTVC